ncbi:MAG: histidine kinase [Gemmatimonadota bacterium]
MQEIAVSGQGLDEFAAAFLQAAVMVGIAFVCLYMFARYRRSYFAVWGLAWSLYALRMGAIILFLLTRHDFWLFGHQALTGWTAVAFLWAAVSFSRPLRWRSAYVLLIAFPPVWSYIAIYRLDDFLLAAGPAVLFLAAATVWTGVVLWRHHRHVGSWPAAVTAVGFVLWGLHHLDYPFLRARGAWVPWGYYLDILFALAVASGILLLVLEDQHRGLSVLSRLSDDLQGQRREEALLESLLTRPLTLPAVVGTAMFDRSAGRFVMGAGACSGWRETSPTGAARNALEQMESTGLPAVWPGTALPEAGESSHAFTAALPVFRGERLDEALIVVGSARNPFAALDEPFLVALGRQVGAALANAELHEGLERRKAELERLAARMVRQHEEERRRLSRELHDESAQVFAALKLQLGILREASAADRDEALDRAEELVRSGIRSIRAAARELRPALLDDLGLLPALRALADDFAGATELAIDMELEPVPRLADDAELALYRSLQEGLSNVTRHAVGATRVEVRLARGPDAVVLELVDDGRSEDGPSASAGRGGEGGTGLIGMRERLAALGGSVEFLRTGSGARLRVEIPLPGRAA